MTLVILLFLGGSLSDDCQITHRKRTGRLHKRAIASLISFDFFIVLIVIVHCLNPGSSCLLYSLFLHFVGKLACKEILSPRCLMSHHHAIVSQCDITTDWNVAESLGADKFNSMEQILQYLVDSGRSISDFFLHFGCQIQLFERTNFKTSGKSEISVTLRQVSNTDQAEYTNFKYSITSILSYKEIDTKSSDSISNLDIDPDQILSIHQHQRYQLFIDVLGKRLERKPSDICLHEAQELVQDFSFDSNHLAIVHKIYDQKHSLF